MAKRRTPPEVLALPRDGFIRQKPLLRLIPISGTTLWRKVKAGVFPAPVKLSPSIIAWRVQDVRAWIEQSRKNAWT